QGGTSVYTFTLAQDATLLFDSLTATSGLNWSLSGPTGAVVSGRAFASSDSVDLSGDSSLHLLAGDYTLSVRVTRRATPGFSFHLLNFAAATTIAVGATVNGTLAQSGNATDLYQFDAAARDRMQFDAISTATSGLYWRLFNPFGNQIGAVTNFADSG